MSTVQLFQLCYIFEIFHNKNKLKDPIIKWFQNYSCLYFFHPSRNSFKASVPSLWAVLFHLLIQGCQACGQGMIFFQVVKSLLHHSLDSRTLSSSVAKAGPLCLSFKRKEECRRHAHLLKPKPSCRQHNFCLPFIEIIESRDYILPQWELGYSSSMFKKRGISPTLCSMRTHQEAVYHTKLQSFGTLNRLQTPWGQKQCFIHLVITKTILRHELRQVLKKYLLNE